MSDFAHQDNIEENEKDKEAFDNVANDSSDKSNASADTENTNLAHNLMGNLNDNNQMSDILDNGIVDLKSASFPSLLSQLESVENPDETRSDSYNQLKEALGKAETEMDTDEAATVLFNVFHAASEYINAHKSFRFSKAGRIRKAVAQKALEGVTGILGKTNNEELVRDFVKRVSDSGASETEIQLSKSIELSFNINQMAKGKNVFGSLTGVDEKKTYDEDGRKVVEDSVSQLLQINLTPDMLTSKYVSKNRGKISQIISSVAELLKTADTTTIGRSYVFNLPARAAERIEALTTYITTFAKLMGQDRKTDESPKIDTSSIKELKPLNLENLKKNEFKNVRNIGFKSKDYNALMEEVSEIYSAKSDYTGFDTKFRDAYINAVDNGAWKEFAIEMGIKGVQLETAYNSDRTNDIFKYIQKQIEEIEGKNQASQDKERLKRLYKARQDFKIAYGLMGASKFTSADKSQTYLQEAVFRSPSATLGLRTEDFFETDEERVSFMEDLGGVTMPMESTDAQQKEVDDAQTRQDAAIVKFKQLIMHSYNKFEERFGLEMMSPSNFIKHRNEFMILNEFCQQTHALTKNPKFCDMSKPEDVRFMHQERYFYGMATIYNGVMKFAFTDSPNKLEESVKNYSGYKEALEDLKYLRNNPLIPVKK